MKDFWTSHRWPKGERRLHWFVVFEDEPLISACYNAHVPVLEAHNDVVDVVAPEWLHMTLVSLCPPTALSTPDIDSLVRVATERLSKIPPPFVQLGPARVDGAAVTWAVYPGDGVMQVQQAVHQASIEVLGNDRTRTRGTRWWPHVTLGYGTRDDPADELAADLAREMLPRVDVNIADVALVNLEQDLAQREYRWETLHTVNITGRIASS